MLAGLITGTRKFELREVSEPRLIAGSAIVDITLCGICGTDVSAYKHGLAFPPALCGHEWTGTVRAVAKDVSYLQEGDRVLYGAPPPCGMHCAACRQGRYEACSTVATAFMGGDGFSPESGGYALRQAVDARRLVKIPASISDVQAAMAEPATVAAHGVRRSGLLPGERIAVIGAGPIGLFAMQIARAAGAGTIMVIEPDHGRRRLAHLLGADHVSPPGAEASEWAADTTDALGLDRVFDCAGGSTTLQDAASLVRQHGTVMLIGYAAEQTKVDAGAWLLRELAVRTSFAFDKEDTQAVLGMMEKGHIAVEAMHSETVGLDHVETALSELGSSSGKVKILVDPRL